MGGKLIIELQWTEKDAQENTISVITASPLRYGSTVEIKSVKVDDLIECMINLLKLKGIDVEERVN